MGNIIAVQNEKLINKHHSLPNPQTNTCRNTKSCPLSGNCLEKNIIYQATARINFRTMDYFGLCETDFKTRYYSHTHSFRNRFKYDGCHHLESKLRFVVAGLLL